jgi:septal ring factor EnvC (AmiA/AmiB activator)
MTPDVTGCREHRAIPCYDRVTKRWAIGFPAPHHMDSRPNLTAPSDRSRPAGFARVAAAVVAAGLLSTTAGASPTAPAGDKTLQELQRQREAVRSKRAQAAAQVDATKASDAQVNAALADLNANISSQVSLLEDARRAVAEADQAQKDAAAAEAAAAAELAKVKDDLVEQTKKAFVENEGDATIDVLSADSLADAAVRRTLIRSANDRKLDTTERYRTVQADLADARARSQAAAQAAESRRRQVDERLDSLQAAQEQAEQFAAEIESRMEAQLAEADSLATLDNQLASDINNRQSQLAAQLAAQRAAAADRASKAGARSTSSSGRSGSSSGGGARTLPSSGGNGIVSVRGIRVDQSIASSLESMLAAAEADGVQMSGGGYRDPAAQIAVRRNNCGSSDYAIYQAPASSCHPPTARPGQSMHEQGLAIDFTQNGRTLTRGSSAFSWLKANAARFGFFNLPSEPWHWSTNGR